MRPFFSIIVPCCNSVPERIRELLTSVRNQNMSDDIEVIIVDDCSKDKSFLEVLKEFDDLQINQITTPEDSIHCPGNTREAGVQVATGEWITFVDHDDMLETDTFSKIKQEIIDREIQHVAICNFKEVFPETLKTKKILNHTMNWMHAKFYNLDNFWKPRNIHFDKTSLSHEDTYVSVNIECELHEMGSKFEFIEISCLMWRAWQDSLSRSYFGEDSYLEYFYKDYVEATGYVFVNRFLKFDDETKKKEFSWYSLSCVENILYQYFYIQQFKFLRPFDYRLDAELISKEYIRTFYKVFGVNKNFLLDLIYYRKDLNWYYKVKEKASGAMGHFIESDSFKDFIDIEV